MKISEQVKIFTQWLISKHDYTEDEIYEKFGTYPKSQNVLLEQAKDNTFPMKATTLDIYLYANKVPLDDLDRMTYEEKLTYVYLFLEK